MKFKPPGPESSRRRRASGDPFGRPARGNDKGNVEGMVGYTRRNFMVPAPRYDSFDDLNAYLEQRCLERQGDKLRGHNMTIGERLMSDLDALMGLPVAQYEACDHVSTRATSISMVRYPLPGSRLLVNDERGSNDYSVPVAYAHHDVHVRGLETFEMDIVQGAIQLAIDMGAIGYDAVKHLVLCRVEKRPPRLDLDFYPYLPKANVRMTRSSSDMSLMGGATV